MKKIIKRILYYFIKKCAFVFRPLGQKVYVKTLICAYNILGGIKFNGLPKFIHYNSYLDNLGGLEIGKDVVISTNVIILTHDFSYNVGLLAVNKAPDTDQCIFQKVILDDYCFIGAGTIILPGSIVGKYSVIGAGSIVKGNIPPYSVVAGNPAKIIGNVFDLANKFNNNATEK